MKTPVTRSFLTEDVRLIQKYFPGAEAVALRTPFDITTSGGMRPALRPDSDRPAQRGRWLGDIAWEQA